MFSNAPSSFVRALSSSSLLLLASLVFGCGEDSSGSTDAGTQPSSDGAVGGNVTYNGTLVSILSVDTSGAIVIPHFIELLDNETGQPLVPPVSTMSVQGTGAITLTGPRGEHIMYVHGTGTGDEGTTDTVLLNADVEIRDPLIRIATAGLGSIAGQTAGFAELPDRAALTGAVYWLVGNQRMGTVGCAKVYLDGATGPDTDQGQLYTGPSGLPVPLATQSQTLKGGVFYFANIKPGPHTLKVSLDDGKSFVGEETRFFIPFTRSQAKSDTKAVLAQMAFYVKGATNPTLPSCAM